MALLTWSKSFGRRSKHRIAQLRELLNKLESECQEHPSKGDLIAQRTCVQKDLNLILAQEESYWRQRSQIFWMREGDRNTRFFHATTSQRRQRNEVTNLRGENGQQTSSKKEMSIIAETYFPDIF